MKNTEQELAKVLEKARWEFGAKTLAGEKIDSAEYYAKAILSSGLVIPVSALDRIVEKNQINSIVQKRYDELMSIGEHGHYETLFQVVHEQRQANIVGDVIYISSAYQKEGYVVLEIKVREKNNE